MAKKKHRSNDMWTKSADSEVRTDELQDMIELADGPETVSEADPIETENAGMAPQTAGDSGEKPAAEEHPDLAERIDAAVRGRLRRIPALLAAVGAWFVRGASSTGAWLGRCMAAIGNGLYEVGYYAEYGLVRAWRTVSAGSKKADKALLVALKWLGRMLVWPVAAVFKLILRPFYHVAHGVRNVYHIWYTRDPDHPGKTWRETLGYIGDGIKRNAHLIPDVLGWLLPVAAAGLFVFTVRTVMAQEYVLQVSFDGNVLGYVQGDEVVEQAQQDVQRRIVYTEDDAAQEEWSVSPTYVLAVNDDVEVLSADQVADAILENSGMEITEATGFYLGGTFYGATTEGDRLAAELEAIKAPYATGTEGEYLSFVVEPELVDGIYLLSSVVPFEELNSLIHSQVAGEVRYTVVTGDTPSGIAYDHGLTTDELVSMNPGQDILKSLHPGDSLVVSQAVSFLQVKVTYRVTEQEAVPYETVRITTPDLSFGFTKIKTQGVEGLDECVYDYVYIDGVLQSKTLISRTNLYQPITQEILVGTTVRPGVTIIPSEGGMMWPIPGFRSISRGFTGVYKHNGMDITGSVGTPIYAAQTGVVTRAVYGNRGYGIYVVVDHGGGYSTLYGHCSGLAVGVGDIVNQGDLIAYLGNTGNSTGPHCHFEVRINGTRVDPAGFVGWGG